MVVFITKDDTFNGAFKPGHSMLSHPEKSIWHAFCLRVVYHARLLYGRAFSETRPGSVTKYHLWGMTVRTPQHYTYSYGEYERKSDMRHFGIAGLWGRSMAAFSVITLGILMAADCGPSHIALAKKASVQCQAGHQVGFLSGLHGELMDASGCQVMLTGVN